MAMCLIQRKNRIYYGVFSDRGRRVWESTGCRDRAEAEAVYDEQCREHNQWRGITISKYRDMLVELLAQQLSSSTLSLYRSAFTSLATIVGDLRLAKLSAFHAQKFQSGRLNQVSNTRVSIEFRTIRAGLNRAVRFKIIGSNPFKDVDNVRIPQSDPVYLTKEQFRQLFNAIDDYRLRAIVLLAICTSMRVSEILGLRWEDVDLEREVIRLSNHDSFMTKNRRRRLVPLNATAKQILLHYPHVMAHVFVSRRNKPFTRQSISRLFKKYVRRAGLPEELHFHSLRHSAATWMAQNNVSIQCIAAVLGHSNITTSMIYAHAVPTHLLESVGTIDRVLEDELKPVSMEKVSGAS